MNNPTRYICPKCGHALMFWANVLDVDTPCRCMCMKCKDEPGLGINAETAFADWQKKNETQKVAG